MTNMLERPSRFTPAQYEVVNMMSCVTRPADIIALKSLLVQFLNTRIQAEIDELYDEGALGEERMSELAAMHLRTPYATAQ